MAEQGGFDLQVCGETFMAPSWQREKTFGVGKTQTDPEPKVHDETQTTISALSVTEGHDKGEGTEPRHSLVPPARCDGTQYVYNSNPPHYNAARLLPFLEGCQSDVLAMLEQNLKTTAYDDYEPNWRPRVDSVTRTLTLSAPHTVDAEWHVTGLSWNTLGTIIAIAYGRVDTVGWCKSRGYACCWNVSRSDLDVQTPHQTIETDSYVTALAFHPTMPSVLAVGTYNGEISIWSVTSDDATRLYLSKSSGSGSREPVAKMQWLQNPQDQRDAHRFVLCATSQDGKVLFWSTGNNMAEPIASYEVRNRRRNPVGVQSMSFVRSAITSNATKGPAAPSVDDVMLVGMENGDLYRTKPGITAAAARQAATGASTLEVDPFEGHSGPVHGLDCSPFLRTLFATCASDGALRLYTSMERTPQLTLEPSTETKSYLYGVAFSPSRASVIATCSRSGWLYIYDLHASKSKPTFAVEAGTDGAALTALAFNGAQDGEKRLAVGDAKGNVSIWQLSSALTQPVELERAAVRRLAEGVTANNNKNKEVEGNAEPVAGRDPIRELLGFSL